MLKGFLTLFFIAGTALLYVGNSAAAGLSWQSGQLWQENICVACHSRISEPVTLSNRYFEWHTSIARRLELSVKRMELTRAREALRDMKISWHAFDLDNSRKKADEAFTAGVRARDQLQKKLGYQISWQTDARCQ